MMSVGFDSDEIVLKKLRERLRRMTDEELIRFGKEVRRGLRKICFSGNWMKRERSGSGGKVNRHHNNRVAPVCVQLTVKHLDFPPS
jgi:hypothetical protein